MTQPSRPPREILLGRARDLVARAARLCPDADDASRESAARRIAAEAAAALGIGFPDASGGWPAGGERDLLDAAEALLGPDSAPLVDGIRPLRAPHPLGGGHGPEGETCGSCAWRRRGACLSRQRSGEPAPRIRASTPSCARWEPLLGDDSCGPCGACCREGYSWAPVRRGETMLRAHPEWIRREGAARFLPRPHGRCVALEGDGAPDSPWRCRDYPARPRACSGLEPGSLGCLAARRRTGLSR